MVQKRPDYHPNGIYHIYNRGSHRVEIFHEPENYIFVIRKTKKYSIENNLDILAYCLLPNHSHLMILQLGDQPAGVLPQRVFNSYSKAFNNRYNHSGTLFEGPYKVIQITNDSHLLHLCRYIHANPVKNGLVDNLKDWPYSNYLEWTNTREGTLVNRDFIQSNFNNSELYARFVEEYLLEGKLPQEVNFSSTTIRKIKVQGTGDYIA